MDSLQTTVLVIASIILLGGGALIGYRELTAPDRRRVGPIRDVIEVALPLLALFALVIGAWVVL